MDDERADPDEFDITPAGPLVAQAEAGDAHTIRKEYRGYILDGGGLNGFGGGGHPGGHIRLDPARKEILVEVDRAAAINANSLPAGGIAAVMNGASGVFSNSTRGAGIYMYWLMDEVALDLPVDKTDELNEILDTLSSTRNLKLISDFIHLLVIDEGVSTAFNDPNTAAVTADRATTKFKQLVGMAALKMRGSVVGPTDVYKVGTLANYPKKDEFVMTTIVHELIHQLIDTVNAGGFDADEHTNEGAADIMDGATRRKSTELLTVKFTTTVQKVLYTKTGEWGTE